ncbi:MAG TPA: transglycosylase SLT domain-containing protein [Patescibacteria group bacterium]|nr:transglycosylase SLT domain-containing protein [Patescibacteria group bacterium]
MSRRQEKSRGQGISHDTRWAMFVFALICLSTYYVGVSLDTFGWVFKFKNPTHARIGMDNGQLKELLETNKCEPENLSRKQLWQLFVAYAVYPGDDFQSPEAVKRYTDNFITATRRSYTLLDGKMDELHAKFDQGRKPVTISGVRLPWSTLVWAKTCVESQFLVNAYNKQSGAGGLSQFWPPTARRLSVKVWDPYDSLEKGELYLTMLEEEAVRHQLTKADAFALYHMGGGNAAQLRKVALKDWDIPGQLDIPTIVILAKLYPKESRNIWAFLNKKKDHPERYLFLVFGRAILRQAYLDAGKGEAGEAEVRATVQEAVALKTQVAKTMCAKPSLFGAR